MAAQKTDRANLLDAIAASYERGLLGPAYPPSFFDFRGDIVGQSLRETAKRIRTMHAERMKDR